MFIHVFAWLVFTDLQEFSVSVSVVNTVQLDFTFLSLMHLLQVLGAEPDGLQDLSSYPHFLFSCCLLHAFIYYFLSTSSSDVSEILFGRSRIYWPNLLTQSKFSFLKMVFTN